jgi:hypothetical protein
MTSFWLATTYYLASCEWRLDGDLSWSARPGRDQYITERNQPEFTTTRCSGRPCHLAQCNTVQMGDFRPMDSVSLSATRRLALRTAGTSRTWIREGSSFSSRNYLGRPTILIPDWASQKKTDEFTLSRNAVSSRLISDLSIADYKWEATSLQSTN